MKTPRWLAFAVVLGIALAGCADSEATPTARPTAVATAPPATLTPAATSAPTRLPPAPPTLGPDGSPPGYGRSCAAAFPWGRQVTAGFVCIEPPFGIERAARGELSGFLVQGYAGGSFENSVVVELVQIATDGTNGPPLVRQATTYRSPDVGMPGSWSAFLQLGPAPQQPPAVPPAGRLRVVAYFESPRDGARVAEDSLDLK